MKQATMGATKRIAHKVPRVRYQAMHEAMNPANGRLNFFCCDVIFIWVIRCDFPDTPRKKGIEEICRDPLLASVARQSSGCSSSRGPFGLFSRWITGLGALRCTPGAVATPLDCLGLSIAAFESGPVSIRQGVSLKSGEA